MESVVLVILVLEAAFLSLIGYVVYSIVRVRYRWRAAEIQRMMDRWAAANRVSIVAMRRPTLREHLESSARGRVGPFRATGSQAVVWATVADKKGRERSGWFLLGGFFLGLFSEHVAVKWDDWDENPAGTASGVYDSWLDE